MKLTAALALVSAAGTFAVCAWWPAEPPVDNGWETALGNEVSTLKKAGYRVLAAGGTELAALDALTGHPAWKVETAAVIDLVEPAGDLIFIVDRAGTVTAVRALDGAIVWRLRSAAPLARGGFSFDARSVYVSTLDGVVQAVDANTGRSEWSQAFGEPAAVGACAALAGVAVATPYGEVILYAKPDRIVWRRAILGEPVSVAGMGRLVVVCLKRGVIALDVSRGATAWELTDGVFTPRGVLNGRVVLAEAGGDAVIIDEDGGTRVVTADDPKRLRDRGWEWVAEGAVVRKRKAPAPRRGRSARPRPPCSRRRPRRLRRRPR